MRTYERKLITVGNSVGVTFPPEILNAFELKAGDWLELELKVGEDGADGEIVITKSTLRERTHAHQNEVSQHRRELETRVETRARVRRIKK